VRFANRAATKRALVLPGEAAPSMGAILLEAMDLVVEPKERRLVINPKHPYVAQHYLK
jgi:hypothetical protein